jgi:hypothetical protein
MNRNRRLVLGFRVSALVVTMVGLALQVSLFEGLLSLRSFMSYTAQSNLLAVVLFAILTVRTVYGRRVGRPRDPPWCSRLVMVVSVDLLVTLVVFWTLLAPLANASYLLGIENLLVHTVTPLAPLADFLLFSSAGQVKYRDVYYACIFPLSYLTGVVGVALSGRVYYLIADTTVRFPYFFLDFDLLGWTALQYLVSLLGVFLVASHLVYLGGRYLGKGLEPG